MLNVPGKEYDGLVLSGEHFPYVTLLPLTHISLSGMRSLALLLVPNNPFSDPHLSILFFRRLPFC